MERIENLIELKNFLNNKTDEELENMIFEFEERYWDDYWLRMESTDKLISHITFDNGWLVCHPYREGNDND